MTASVMPGSIIVERQESSTGEVWWKSYAVKSVTATGIVTLLRADEHSSMEAKTTKGFAKMVESGKDKDWRLLQTQGVDRALTDAIVEQEARDLWRKAGEKKAGS